MATIRQAVASATEYLTASGLESAREDSELIIATITGTDRTYLLTHPEDQLNPQQSVEVWRWLIKRSRLYPVQYLRGVQEFYGRDFLVSPSVLVPRPETELVVATCLELISAENDSPTTLLDVGTGSGCIAITLALEEPTLQVLASDISESALAVARYNARSYGCADRVEIILGDLVQPAADWGAPFDLVVSNPPYVAVRDQHLVAPSVLKYEPPQAVFAGESGLEIYRRLLTEVPGVLKSGGHLILELGMEQASSVGRMSVELGWVPRGLSRDLAGIERCAVFQKP
jgi:release factor glutamine methyltransferase